MSSYFTDIRAELLEDLARTPGLTAREMATRLSLRSRTHVGKRTVNQVLYRNLHLFTYDGDPSETAPRWSVSSPYSDGNGGGPPWGTGQMVLEPLSLRPWQVDALVAWRARGCRGIIEAVTGAGKSRVGLTAMQETLKCRGKVLVLVPTKELQSQWFGLVANLGADIRIGTLGGGSRDNLTTRDVLVAIVNSARAADLDVPHGSLLIADECHRYGSASNQQALDCRFSARLGLSATYARADDGCQDYLDPYFGGVCFRVGYDRALAENAIAHFSVALIGTRFSDTERIEYEKWSKKCGRLRLILLRGFDVPEEPFGEFMQAVSRLAESGQEEGASAARQYLEAFSERRRLLAETPVKFAALLSLVEAIRRADRTLVFTQTIAGADVAQQLLAGRGLDAGCVHSEQPPDERRRVLDEFRAGRIRVIAAPQVLDEGVDVPEADLAIIIAASKTHRQMIQRMGRVLRRKSDGRLARFAILYVESTSEDPAGGAHETFLDEVTDLADAYAQFAAGTDPALITRFLSALVAADAKALLAQVAPVGVSPAPAAPDPSLLFPEPVTSGSLELLRGWTSPLTSFQATQLRRRLEADATTYQSALQTTLSTSQAAQLHERIRECAEALKLVDRLAPPVRPREPDDRNATDEGVTSGDLAGNGYAGVSSVRTMNGAPSVPAFRLTRPPAQASAEQREDQPVSIRSVCRFCRCAVVYTPDAPNRSVDAEGWRVCECDGRNAPGRLHVCSMLPQGETGIPLQSLPRPVYHRVTRMRSRAGALGK